MKRKIAILLTLTLSISSLTGCTAAIDEDMAVETEDMEELMDGHFYVQHNNEFYPCDMDEINFEGDEDNKITNPKRVVWYAGERDMPTLYQGDKLIYCSSNEMPDEFLWERFKDEGYTIGISNLSELNSGKYSLYIGKKNSKYIQQHSDAKDLYGIKDVDNVIIDSIGEVELTSQNFNEAGLIKGLEKGKTYDVAVYAGTHYKEYEFTADVKAYSSTEFYSSYNFEFIKSNVAIIEIPDYFESGYYMINGMGMFRYIKEGDSYDENTDFNIKNVIPNNNEATMLNDDEAEPESDDVE